MKSPLLSQLCWWCYGFLLPFVAGKYNTFQGPSLELTSNQPVIMGSNITFTLKLSNPERDSYDVEWTELCRLRRNSIASLDKGNNYTVNWTLPYAFTAGSVEYINPGTYTVSATVTYIYIFMTIHVGTSLSNYYLTPNFTGTLESRQDGVVLLKKTPNVISTANETTLVANVHDPTNFLALGENITYSWYDSKGFIANTTDPSLKQNITTDGVYYYNVTVSGIYNSTNGNSTIRSGMLQVNITAETPITNFTVGGELWFPQGKMLNLKISCGGTKPYIYCVQMRPGPYNLTGNETCPVPAVTTDCTIRYTWYFGNPGTHSLVIIIENDISRIVNRTLVNVYKVSKQQPLSIIIVPLSCSLLALVMIIFGIAYFWENRTRYSIEVADFDFGQRDELPYMTLMERLKSSLTASTSSRQRLYNGDDDPIMNSRRGSQFE